MSEKIVKLKVCGTLTNAVKSALIGKVMAQHGFKKKREDAGEVLKQRIKDEIVSRLREIWGMTKKNAEHLYSKRKSFLETDTLYLCDPENPEAAGSWVNIGHSFPRMIADYEQSWKALIAEDGRDLIRNANKVCDDLRDEEQKAFSDIGRVLDSYRSPKRLLEALPEFAKFVTIVETGGMLIDPETVARAKKLLEG